MLISFLRTVVLYLLLIVTVRLMGKRQIGEMEPAEFVVTMQEQGISRILHLDLNQMEQQLGISEEIK